MPIRTPHLSDPRAAPAPREQIYVWELPVRVTHWVFFFSFLILSATGYYIGHPFISVPGPAANGHFVMGTARAIHLYTAIVFSLAVWFASIGCSSAIATPGCPSLFR